LNRTSAVEYSPEERSFYRYPFDLGDVPEHQNFMVFDIFVNGGEGLSSEVSKKPAFQKAAESIDKAVKKITSATNLGKALVPEALAVTTVLGNVSNNKFLSKLQGVSSTLKKVNFYTSGMALSVGKQLIKTGQQDLSNAGKGEDSFVQEALGLGESLKRANKTIFLYMPGGVSSKYGAKYTEKDLQRLLKFQLPFKAVSKTW
jgi:hypothetical protein